MTVPSVKERTLNPARTRSEERLDRDVETWRMCSVPRGSSPERTWLRSSDNLGSRASYSNGESATWTDEKLEGVKVVAAN